jgi:NADH:ubiquinone reductase (H+-translocating)
MAGQHRVVIVGGGFGGLNAARALRKAPVSVTVIDRRNFHLFQPLLYQVATAVLSPGDIASPLRLILRRQQNASVLLGEVISVDVAGRQAVLGTGDTVPYDTLILAPGSTHSYFGHDEWEARAPGLKTIENAIDIRRRILLAYEAAERAADPAERRAWLTFVVVGGGPTGVELAGASREIAQISMRDNFRHIDPGQARVLLIEAEPRLVPPFAPGLASRAQKQLERLGVEVMVNTKVTAIDDQTVTVEHAGQSSIIPARTALWAAGVKASPLGRALCEAAGCQTDRAGRVPLRADLTVPGHPEICVIGDLALVKGRDGKPLPGVAPVAMQQGTYVAKLIAARLAGKSLPAFRYRDKGSMATIGRAAAIAQIGPLHFGGYPAWLVWLFVHLMYIVEFQNRILVFIQWAWNYFTKNRGARLITGEDLLPPK